MNQIKFSAEPVIRAFVIHILNISYLAEVHNHRRLPGVFNVTFEQILLIILLVPLSTLKK